MMMQRVCDLTRRVRDALQRVRDVAAMTRRVCDLTMQRCSGGVCVEWSVVAATSYLFHLQTARYSVLLPLR